MRPGQNKRMRGRNNNNNNNRKGPNPLTRSYESNGPDVKIRGTAQHVAEKYLQLARDAQSSGDPVMAESYLQHAEHYFRIIATAQQAQQQQHQANLNRQQNDNPPEAEDTSAEDADVLNDRFSSPAERAQAILNQPQPNVSQQGNPFGGQQNEGSGQSSSNGRQDRSGQDRSGQDRGGRNSNRRSRNFDSGEGNNRPPRPEQEAQARHSQADSTVNDSSDDNQPTLPSFITGGSRTQEPAPASSAGSADNKSVEPAPAHETAETPRPRRRRRPAPRANQDTGATGDDARPNPDEVPADE